MSLPRPDQEIALVESSRHVRSSQSARWLGFLWAVLGLLLLSLIGLAGYLFVKMDFFSGGPLTDEQLKSLWAFLGVALGAVVTLVGTLLTDQHNRRTAAIEREAEERQRVASENQQALAREAEERQRLAGENQQALATQAERRNTLDTVARTMELITENGEYAKTARVGGAIATMVELEGGAVAMRILGELWIADAVDSDTAVWSLLTKRLPRTSTECAAPVSSDAFLRHGEPGVFARPIRALGARPGRASTP